MSIACEENNTITSTTETQEFSIDSIINQKVKTATSGLQKSVQDYFLEFSTERDKEIAADFLIACSQKENVAIRTKRVYLIALTYLSRFLEKRKSFDGITAKERLPFSIACTKTKRRTQRKAGYQPNAQWV